MPPLTYDQYLSLRSPTATALSAHYTAIADDNVIYVYDSQQNLYRQYTHPKKVTKLQFDDEENLYFLDASTMLFILNPATLAEEFPTVTETGYLCNNFVLHEKHLYSSTTSTNISQIFRAPLSDLRAETAETLFDDVFLAPSLAVYQNQLYYTHGKILYRFDPQTKDKTLIAEFPSVLLSLALTDNKLACVTDDGDFYVYALPDLSATDNAKNVEPLYHANGFSSLSLYEKHLYVVCDNAVKQYSFEENEFTDREISGASAAPHRFNSATDLYLCDETLFIADDGNRRVSVYDTATNAFLTPISVSHSVDHLAAYGDTLLVANDSQATLIHLSEENYGKKLTEKNNFSGSLVGVASVYGNYYLVSEKNYFYALTPNENTGGYGWTTAHKAADDPLQTEQTSPRMLTADANGFLYVAYGESVRMYTETQFTSTALSAENLSIQLPAETQKMATDYRGNVYALTDQFLYKYAAPKQKGEAYTQTDVFNVDRSLVYSGDETIKAVGFALSVQENAAYLLYDRHYVAQTAQLRLPTVKTIPVNGADDKLFEAESADIVVVQTEPNALLIEFDINALQGANVFPYLSYERSGVRKTALKLGSSDVYDLIAVYDGEKKAYSTYLVNSNACRTLSADEYRTEYSQAVTGYLSNGIRLYKLPYLTSLLTVCEMPRGAEVTILGEIAKLDHAYYHVAYVNEQGERKTGYIPRAYVSPTQDNTPSESLTIGGEHSRTDAYGRLAYLLLGTAAICALIDYLILRKPKDEPNE